MIKKNISHKQYLKEYNLYYINEQPEKIDSVTWIIEK
jgi:hypothetical protein